MTNIAAVGVDCNRSAYHGGWASAEGHDRGSFCRPPSKKRSKVWSPRDKGDVREIELNFAFND